jgi:hypothetical protein
MTLLGLVSAEGALEDHPQELSIHSLPNHGTKVGRESTLDLTWLDYL